MPDSPARLWKEMPVDKRVIAADAFWRDEDSPDIQVQQMEAIVALARRLNFRTRSLLAMPVDRRAKQLAQMSDVTDGVATRALIAYHFGHQRPLMGAFLDALGIAHDQGLITEEEVKAPERDRLQAAVAAVRAAFPKDDADLYFRTLVALDGGTWSNMESVLND
jgi:hypothetical protein